MPFIVVAAVLGAFSSRAAAEPWLEGHAELGLVSGHFEFDKPYRTFEDLPAVAHDEGGPLGIAVGLGGIVGMRVRSKVGLGLAPRVEFAPYLENVRPRHSTVSSHALAGVGPLLAFRPSPSLELRFSTEWVWATHHGSTNDIGADDNVFEHEALNGPGATLWLGSVSTAGWLLGLTGRVAHLTGNHVTFIPLWFAISSGWSNW